MIHQILETLAQWIMDVQKSWGYSGIFILMAIESACIPLPSELIMPFAGFLVAQGAFDLWGASVAGAAGCVFGGWIAYGVGFYKGRGFIEKYGKFILLNPQDVIKAEKLFERHGEIVAFVGRLLPVIRTFIALPLGIGKMHFWRFSIFSFLGSLPFCFALTWLGMKMGENWRDLKDYFHKADLLIGALLLIGAYFWIKHHFFFLKSQKTGKKL